MGVAVCRGRVTWIEDGPGPAGQVQDVHRIVTFPASGGDRGERE